MPFIIGIGDSGSPISNDTKVKNKTLKNKLLVVSNNVNIIADRKWLSLPQGIIYMKVLLSPCY